jgi:hypothetical protein
MLCTKKKLNLLQDLRGSQDKTHFTGNTFHFYTFHTSFQHISIDGNSSTLSTGS